MDSRHSEHPSHLVSWNKQSGGGNMAVHVEYIIRLYEECFSQENFSSYVDLRPSTHYLAYGWVKGVDQSWGLNLPY